jgi:hypothetical protein
MKKLVFLAAVVFTQTVAFSSSVTAAESVASSEKKSTTLMKDPFCTMSPEELAKTGIAKLTPDEQEALTKWWYQHKASPHKQHIVNEVTVSSIQEGGKFIALSDGETLSFSASKRKKTSLWEVGDTIGIGEGGKKGAVTLYHMASGAKVKGKRSKFSKKSDKNASQNTEKTTASK